MQDSSVEASIDMVQALKRVLYLYRPHFQPPNLPRRVAQMAPAVLQKVEEKIEALDKSTEKLLGITKKAHDILFRANTVFPFTLFRDTVTVDREKLTIANRFFFATAKITSVPIRDILNVEADIGPFFGSVHLTSRYFFTNPRSINFLTRKDTLALQRLLQGYIILHEQNIDCSDLNTPQLRSMLEDLGKGDTD